MREIIFRGKRIDTGELVYGDLVHGNEYHPEDLLIRPFECVAAYSVHPDTVGQYTLLKDKNGVKVFEGDILRWNHCSLGLIVYGEDRFGMVFTVFNMLGQVVRREPFEPIGLSVQCATARIIGNIHDNPELWNGVT